MGNTSCGSDAINTESSKHLLFVTGVSEFSTRDSTLNTSKNCAENTKKCIKHQFSSISNLIYLEDLTKTIF